MEGVTKEGKDRQLVKKDLLKYLEKFEEGRWEIFGWHHMHLEKRQWLAKPQNLAESQYYKVIKNWIQNGVVVAIPLKSSPDGLVQYKDGEKTIEGFDSGAFAESVFFMLWLAKDEKVCLISYGEHRFNNSLFEYLRGRASYSIVFSHWKEIMPAILFNQNKESAP